jgi:DNA-binding transcriptional ArsR family regulator
MGKFAIKANIFKALSVERRLELLWLLRNGEKYGSQLFEKLGLSLKTTTTHLRILAEADLVFVRKANTRIFYSINPKIAETLTKFLQDLFILKPDTNAHIETSRRRKRLLKQIVSIIEG